MTTLGEGRFEDVARKARRVQDAVERVRGRATVAGVCIEVAADGRITGLELPDSTMAQAVSRAHEQALAHACEQAADLRRELVDDPVVAAAARRFAWTAAAASNSPAPQADSFAPPEDSSNPYALPAAVRRRYGVD
ncbi:hypothetical protein [Nocardia concava]|uniref:hypothetical protein n=1 Tax=Nocardia concava TaxID=257281 RepID=UPI0012FB471D|nr:hypothetical protein [Nocardia concava]